MTKGIRGYPTLKFAISKEELHKKAVRGKRFMNFFVKNYPGVETGYDSKIYMQALKEWSKLTVKGRKKYEVLKEDGTVRLDYIQKEARINGKSETLAY